MPKLPVVVAVGVVSCGPAPEAPSVVASVDPPPARARPAPDVGSPAPPLQPPREIGCWEATYGHAPTKLEPSLPGPMKGCDGCERLAVGPNAVGLHPQVLQRLVRLVDAQPAPRIQEPVAWINSGPRDGPPAKSMHNQGLAIDLVICGQDTTGTAAALREVGFSCVIEYYDADGAPCQMAHADMRGTKWAKGAYAKGGRKADTCPKRATSRGPDCQNQSKDQWKYAPSAPGSAPRKN